LSNCGITATDFNSLGMVVGAGNVYFANNSGSVDVCAIDTDGSLSSCAVTGSGPNASAGLALAGNLVYVVSANPVAPGVEVCPINVDGTLGTCTASALPAGASPLAVAVVGNHAYVGDQAAGIYLCAVSPGDGSPSNCTVSNGGASYNVPTQITIY
jgi:hypothetical protein